MEHCNLLSRVNLQVDDSVPEAVFEIFSELGRLGSEPAAPITPSGPKIVLAPDESDRVTGDFVIKGGSFPFELEGLTRFNVLGGLGLNLM